MEILQCREILETFRENDISANMIMTLKTIDLKDMRICTREQMIFLTNRIIYNDKIQEILMKKR